jgi:hypothetical protein
MNCVLMSPFAGVSTAVALEEFTAIPQFVVERAPDLTERVVPVGFSKVRHAFAGPRPPVALLRTIAESLPMKALNIVAIRFSTVTFTKRFPMK